MIGPILFPVGTWLIFRIYLKDKGGIFMNSKGFTVIELLISAAIFALVIGGLTLALIQQQRQNNVTQEAVDLDQTARATLDYIATQIRNAVSRQGKTFSLNFVNGGSTGANPCTVNTGNAGQDDSPPDCLTVFTWDITRGQDGNALPSIPGNIEIVSQGTDMVLQLPQEWFPAGEPPLLNNGDFLGFRSRLNLCNPANPTICGTNPEQCTECAAILQVNTVNTALRQATIMSNAVEQNFKDTAYSSLSEFINGVAINGVNYGFVPNISSQVAEMTIVQPISFRIDTANREFEISQTFNNNGQPINFQPISGGTDAPGIVDLQFVFNLQASDGGITKVGVCSNGNCADAVNKMFSDFDELEAENNPILGSEKDIRTVEIYLMVRSKVRPQLIRGGELRIQTVPAVGDVPERDTDHPSFGPTVNGEPQGVGFMYRTFSTTVYIRNMAREEFG